MEIVYASTVRKKRNSSEWVYWKTESPSHIPEKASTTWVNGEARLNIFSQWGNNCLGKAAPEIKNMARNNTLPRAWMLLGDLYNPLSRKPRAKKQERPSDPTNRTMAQCPRKLRSKTNSPITIRIKTEKINRVACIAVWGVDAEVKSKWDRADDIALQNADQPVFSYEVHKVD